MLTDMEMVESDHEDKEKEDGNSEKEDGIETLPGEWCNHFQNLEVVPDEDNTEIVQINQCEDVVGDKKGKKKK